MSVWTEASLDLDCLPADACAVRWLSSDTLLNTFSRSRLSVVNFLDGCTRRVPAGNLATGKFRLPRSLCRRQAGAVQPFLSLLLFAHG